MKALASLAIVLLLTACGVDTAGTAATAAVKKQEIEQGKQTMEQVQKNLEQVSQQAAQRAGQAADEAK